MTKETTAIFQPPPFSRFILWEILGIVGFLHILQYAPANDPTPLYFLGNSIVFILLYPVIYFYSQLKLPPVLKIIISPLSIFLRLVMMVSSFLWIVYVAYATGYLLGDVSLFLIFKNFWMFMTPFFMMDYFFFLEHLWGISTVNFTFWASVGMISDSVSGVVGGFYLGRILNTKWVMFFGDPNMRTLIWVIFILVGVGAVVWFGNKTRKG